jgi:L-arabinonolactonase
MSLDVASLGEEPVLVLDCRNELAECVLWDDRQGLLWWTNIHAAELWSWDPFDETGPVVHPMPDRVGAFGLCEGGGLILGLASSFALYDPPSGEVMTIVDVEGDLPTTRLNDGRVDAFGCFVCGGMDEGSAQASISAVYRLDEHRRVAPIITGVRCANSICWSPDGSEMYFADMPTGRIDVYTYLPQATPRWKRHLAKVDGVGLPDGSQVDAEGYLWNAEWGGSRIVRYAPDGTVDRAIGMPVANPTCLTFGGPGLDVLFVSTARFGLLESDLASQPKAGGIFALRPGVRGRAEHRYAG